MLPTGHHRPPPASTRAAGRGSGAAPSPSLGAPLGGGLAHRVSAAPAPLHLPDHPTAPPPDRPTAHPPAAASPPPPVSSTSKSSRQLFPGRGAGSPPPRRVTQTRTGTRTNSAASPEVLRPFQLLKEQTPSPSPAPCREGSRAPRREWHLMVLSARPGTKPRVRLSCGAVTCVLRETRGSGRPVPAAPGAGGQAAGAPGVTLSPPRSRSPARGATDQTASRSVRHRFFLPQTWDPRGLRGKRAPRAGLVPVPRMRRGGAGRARAAGSRAGTQGRSATRGGRRPGTVIWPLKGAAHGRNAHAHPSPSIVPASPPQGMGPARAHGRPNAATFPLRAPDQRAPRTRLPSEEPQSQMIQLAGPFRPRGPAPSRSARSAPLAWRRPEQASTHLATSPRAWAHWPLGHLSLQPLRAVCVLWTHASDAHGC